MPIDDALGELEVPEVIESVKTPKDYDFYAVIFKPDNIMRKDSFYIGKCKNVYNGIKIDGIKVSDEYVKYEISILNNTFIAEDDDFDENDLIKIALINAAKIYGEKGNYDIFVNKTVKGVNVTEIENEELINNIEGFFQSDSDYIVDYIGRSSIDEVPPVK
jgi:hypothetical protein